VIGVYFEPEISALASEHVGLFWGQVRKEFPAIQHQPPVLPPLGAIPLPISFDFYPMPRFWLEASGGSTLMQIQKNAFLFNWRKKGTEYPQFDVVKAVFDKNKILFFKFLADELTEAMPKVRLAELTYINLIERCDYWQGPQDTAKVIPRFRLPVPERPQVDSTDFQQITSQRLEPDLTLSTAVRSARSSQDLSKPVLMIEYRATGLLQDADALDSWFARAHDAIGHCFTEMTSPDIQKTYWQPV
jgi:uncharacterized protein (TIGR04255 family)